MADKVDKRGSADRSGSALGLESGLSARRFAAFGGNVSLSSVSIGRRYALVLSRTFDTPVTVFPTRLS